jgi:hypothetical protein
VEALELSEVTKRRAPGGVPTLDRVGVQVAGHNEAATAGQPGVRP